MADNTTQEFEELEEQTGVPFWRVKLPTALQRTYRGRIILTVIGTLFVSILFVLFKDARVLALLLLPAYFLYLAFSIRYDYSKDLLKEVFCICIAVNPNRSPLPRNKGSVTAVFREDDEEGEVQNHYAFWLPERLANEFIVGAGYVIYYNVYEPNRLLSYIKVL